VVQAAVVAVQPQLETLEELHLRLVREMAAVRELIVPQATAAAVAAVQVALVEMHQAQWAAQVALVLHLQLRALQ
jgi:uncharacterized membrane protein YozB (DUF420 family)